MPPHPVPGKSSRASGQDDPLLAAGLLADRFRIEGVIGRGGMGTVYRARQLGLDRKVAIKVLLPELVRSAPLVERFRREAVAAARLSHPNVVTVYDFGATPDGRAFLAMEYLAGTPLDVWIERNGAMPLGQAVDYLREVCAGVDAVHRAGIIHRDLKPSNIILPVAGEAGEAVKVVDFGIALLREVGGIDITGDVMIGTPAYMAPESIEGLAVDARSDIYSLGAVAYELITGRLPFNQGTRGAVLMNHLTKPPRPPHEIVPSLPSGISAAILRALEKDQSARFQTALEFGTALVGALDDPTPAPAEPREGGALAAVLVVEDDEMVRTLIRRALEQSGYEVSTASDGVDALLLLGNRKFDLILSDIDMPNLDGFTLLRLKSEKGIPTPVIFLTAHADPEHEVQGFELGAEDYIKKPFSLGVLRARVQRVLEKSSGV